MDDNLLPRISLAKGVAALLLFAVVGPEPVWLSLRVRVPISDPGSARSVATLVVPPNVWRELFTGFAMDDSRL